MERISVITPLYHGQPYISGLYQVVARNAAHLRSHGASVSIDFILVNDSPDVPVSLPEPPDGFSVQLVTHPENRGIHAARVTGLSYAQGDFILFLDQDDEVTEDFMYRQLRGIGDGDVIVANAWMEQADGSKCLRFPNRYSLSKVPRLITYTLSYNQIASPGQCLIRRDAIPEPWCRFLTQKNGSDDLFLWIIMLSLGKKFVVCPDPLYTHKYTGSNLSTEISKMNSSTLEIANYLEQIPQVGPRTIADLRRSRTFFSDFSAAGPMGKVSLVLKNADMILRRGYWKFRSSQ